MLTLRIVGAISIAATMLGSGTGYSQNYPSRPVHIFTAEAGGGVDVAARVIAQGISGSLGQPVVVENRFIAIAIETVAKLPPDGYSVLFISGAVWLTPFLRDHVPWDPIRDFSPVTLALTSPNILVVHPSLPVKSVKELIALAKAKPGALNYGSGGLGISLHLAAELFKSMAGVNIVHVPYKGMRPAFNDLFSGEVQMMFPVAGVVAPHLRSGRLKALAVTSAQPSLLAPGLPTVAASGVPGYEAGTVNVVFVPAKTPETIITRLNQEMVRFLNGAEAKKKLLDIGIEAVGSSPQELAATMKSEMARMGKVIKDAGIHE